LGRRAHQRKKESARASEGQRETAASTRRGVSGGGCGLEAREAAASAAGRGDGRLRAARSIETSGLGRRRSRWHRKRRQQAEEKGASSSWFRQRSGAQIPPVGGRTAAAAGSAQWS
jgi:hypothetical protein